MVDSKQNVKVSPTDQMVYYLKQHSVILSQISQQISSIAPQASIPSTPYPPYPPFNPLASDVRINAFWFMALAFSLSAALLAIFVQKWVRVYKHILQQYSDPLKSARLRQYLYEGSKGWYMPIVADAVPSLLHLALFLFFVGLVDTTLNINTTIGLSTTVPIGICGLLYILTTLAPIIYPQSPYQNSFSRLIWYAIQKLCGRRFKDRDGKSKSVSTNMARGQMQLSMEATKGRKGRDKRAIQWLLENLTEDAEIESFAMSIPGSFNGDWSLDVWTELSELKEDDISVVARPSLRSRAIPNVLSLIPRWFRTCTTSRSFSNVMIHQPRHPTDTTSIHERRTIYELCRRISHLFDTCNNRAVFTGEDLWRRRARACVEATASLVCHANADLCWFGDILQTLGDIGSFEEVHNLSLAGRDQTFVVRWTCLSIMAIRTILSRNVLFKEHARMAVDSFGQLRVRDRTDEAAEEDAQKIDKLLEDHWELRWELDGAMGPLLNEKISSTAHKMLELYGGKAFLDSVDSETVKLNKTIDILSQRITRQIPGVHFDFPDKEPFLRQTLDLFSDPSKLRFTSCRQFFDKFFDFLKRIDSYRGDDSPNVRNELEQVVKKLFWPKNLLQRKLWSFQDLRDGGGLGFAVELFLLALKQLLSTSPSQESYSDLYIKSFRAITSDRRRYKHSLGTQKILLDAVASDQGFFRTFNYPDNITEEIWVLLGDILEGQTGPHIHTAVQQLTDHQREDGHRYGAKATAVISQLRVSCLQRESIPTG